MERITLTKTHELLEKLATYIMNEVPNRREMNEHFAQVERRFEQVDARLDYLQEQMNNQFQIIQFQLAQKADKRDVEDINGKFDKVFTVLDAMTGSIEEIRIEQRVFSLDLNRIKKHVGRS